MLTTPVICPTTSLPRELDVNVSISRPMAEIATDMTMICFATPEVTFSASGGNDRIRFYSTMSSLAAEVPRNGAAYWAGLAFFSRQTGERPTTMCVGQVFIEPTSATLSGGSIQLNQLKQVSDGGFDISIDGTVTHARNLDFSGVTNFVDVADVLNSALTGANARAKSDTMELKTSSSGDGSEISYATAPPINPQHIATFQNSVPFSLFDQLALVKDGSLSLLYNGALYTVSNLDFSSHTTLSQVETLLSEEFKFAGLLNLHVRVGSNFILFYKEDDVSTSGFEGSPETFIGTDISSLLHLMSNDNPITTAYVESGTPITAKLVSGDLSGGVDIDAVSSLGANATLVIGAYTFSGLNFSNVTSLEEVVTVLNSHPEFFKAFSSSTNGSVLTIQLNNATFITYANSDSVGRVLKISSGTAGELIPVKIPSEVVVASVTDISSMLGWTRETASSNTVGYTPGDLPSELSLIAEAARCTRSTIYGWVIDAKYRDTSAQKAVADWAEARNPSYFSACTNSPQAYNTSDMSNIGFYVFNKGYKRTSVIYHNNAQVYPDMSYIALALSVNYSQVNSALTMKFKQLDGIEPSPLTETNVRALTARRINCYVFVGNTSRTTREGTQGLDTWYTDSLVNLDNFCEELQVAIYNVFLRNRKVPYTQAGQDLLISGMTGICKRYTDNGVFAPRDAETKDNETGFETFPAVDIKPVPVTGASVSDRAQRLAPPILITAYEASAFHKVNVAVNVYS